MPTKDFPGYDLAEYYYHIEQAKFHAIEEKKARRKLIESLTYFADATCNKHLLSMEDHSVESVEDITKELFKHKINVVGFEILRLIQTGFPKEKISAEIIKSFKEKNIGIAPAYVRRLCNRHLLTDSRYSNMRYKNHV